MRMEYKKQIEYIIKHYEEELIRIAYLYLKDWNLAEDAFQETLIKCYLKQGDFRGESSLKTWVFTILTNTCKDILRSPSYNKIILNPQLLTNTYNPSTRSAESVAQHREERIEIYHVVLSLPKKYKEVILLFYYQGLSIKEISIKLAVNESTVKIRLKRAREKMKNLLTREEFPLFLIF